MGWERAGYGLLLLAALLLSFPASAVSVTNIPAADTSLIEVAPENSNGGQAWVLAGRTQNGPYVRALYRFDLTNLPPHAVIQSAALQLEVTGQPGDMEAVNSTFSLHRMLQPWGEGVNVAFANPGQGIPALPGDATWLHRFYPTNTWATPGGAAGIDYVSEGSSFQQIEDPDHSPYRFNTTPEMVADVQAWVSNPETNFGWMLIGNDNLIFTARRFGSREDPDALPLLEVSYVLPLNIEQVTKSGNQIQFSFTSLPGLNHTVEYRGSLTGGGWQTLTNAGLITEPTNILVTDLITSTQRFYRIEAR
jgi:hypothetical protein